MRVNSVSGTTKAVLWLQGFYWVIVVFSMISISKPYHLSVQILFYIFNGLFFALYFYTELTKSEHITVKAVHYIRKIATTFAVALLVSLFSGWSHFGAAYSYSVKSHLFVFLPNSYLFIFKLPYIIQPSAFKSDSIKATKEKAESDQTASVIKASSSIDSTLRPLENNDGLIRSGDWAIGMLRMLTFFLVAAYIVVITAYFIEH